MNKTLSLPAALLLATGLTAQVQNILPSSAATTSPGSWNSTIFYSTTSTTINREGRTQVLYDANDVQNSGVIQSLQFRRPANLGNANSVTTVNLQIDMSASPVNYLAATSTYATNHGASVVGVFNGPVNLPANSSGTWPRPWEAPIPFTTPFPFIAASAASLCIEFQSTGTTGTTIWYVEAATAITGAGSRATNWSPACAHSGGANGSSLSFSSPTIGLTWGASSFQGLPENNPSWNANVYLYGLNGVGGTFGGFTLPVQISSLGLVQTGPNCALANDIIFTLPMTYVTGTTVNGGRLTSTPIPIPNNPTLGGFQIFTQPVALDINQTTQATGLWMGWGSRWTIGDGVRRGEPLTQITRTGNNALTTGTVATYTGPTVLLNL